MGAGEGYDGYISVLANRHQMEEQRRTGGAANQGGAPESGPCAAALSLPSSELWSIVMIVACITILSILSRNTGSSRLIPLVSIRHTPNSESSSYCLILLEYHGVKQLC